MPTINLDELLRAAGSSLGDAQSQLLGGMPLAPTRMAISEATVDMMVTVEGAKGSVLQVAAVNAVQASAGSINPQALSRVTMRFVAMAETAGINMAPAAPPAAPPTTQPPKADGPTGGSTGPSTRPGDIRPPVTGLVPRKPLTRGQMQAEMHGLPDIAPLLAAGRDVKLDFTPIGTDRTMARAVSSTGDVLAVRLLDGTL
ncbi:hypothetical protein [Sandarakinorhabdus sp.]|uniref:hypothetical protein n=1 Tax=Sandarakinorhabdus sp. TaxID=1916663 RepID=UPI00333FCA3B